LLEKREQLVLSSRFLGKNNMKYLRTDEKAVKGSHLIYFGVCRDPVDENISQ
jgi:hypothetical protein